MFLHYFAIISSWKVKWPFISINLNSLHTRMLFAKFGWNWPSGNEDKNVKSLRQRRTTDTSRSEKLTWAFGSGEQKTWIKRTMRDLQNSRQFCTLFGKLKKIVVKVLLGLSTLQVRTEKHLKVFIMALPVIQIIKTKSHTPKGTFLRHYRLRLCVPTRMTKIVIIIKHNGKCLLENLNGSDVMIVYKPR